MARLHTEPKVIAQEDARIGLQGVGRGKQILRSRLPAGIIEALECEDGDYVRWTLYEDGTVVGILIDPREAKPRSIIAEKQAASGTKKKAGAKKASKSKKRPKAIGAADSFAGAFGAEEDDDLDDGSTPAPPKRRPVAIGSSKKAAAAPPSSTKRPAAASSPRAPRREGAISKPGLRRGKGGVRYDNLPE